MDILSFCLGAVAALVLATLVILVVIAFRLSKAVSGHMSDIENLQHMCNTLDIDIRRTIDDMFAESKSYTDSRIDKISNK